MDYTRLGSTGLEVSRMEAGINFFDTANAYSHGSSEEIVGRAVADFAKARKTRYIGASSMYASLDKPYSPRPVVGF